jgi:hypothetical protein
MTDTLSNLEIVKLLTNDIRDCCFNVLKEYYSDADDEASQGEAVDTISNALCSVLIHFIRIFKDISPEDAMQVVSQMMAHGPDEIHYPN